MSGKRDDLLMPILKIQAFAVLLFVLLSPSVLLQAEELSVASDIYSPSKYSPSKANSQSIELADQHFRQARAACEAGDVGAALQFATQAVRADPDHADARRVLGYRRIGEHWAGNYAARRLERGEIWNEKYGWIKTEDLARLETGKRPFGKRWITAEEDARRHVTIGRGWKIRTDHFHITTNHSRQEASRLAARLEALHQLWQQLFGSFSLKPTDLLKRFDRKTTSAFVQPRRSKPFKVVYYRTREEYNAALRRQQPRIEMTLGIYFDTTQTTHFFADEGQDAGTIYHEVVHQFFHESRPSARNVGASSNAWLIEGVACYFESLEERRDKTGQRFFTIGTPTAGRLPAARHRLLVNDFYVPLAELSALGLKDFQQRTDLPRLYSQSAGLVTFLMHSQDSPVRTVKGGRPALVETLQRLYAGRDRVSTLEDLTGRSFAELDREYREFIESLPTAESPLRPPTQAPLVP